MERAKFRRLSWAGFAVWTAAVLACPCHARSEPAQVDLQLILAVDASGSVNQSRFELQRAGYASAFRNLDVLRAIRAGPFKAIAVMMMQWTGPRQQAVVIPWTIISAPDSAEELAHLIEIAPRQLFGGGTSISGAIDFAVTQFALSRWKSDRRVIDVSGDGENNGGRSAGAARDEAVAKNVVINGLPILAIEPFLDVHYRTEVIGGPGAFMIPAPNFDAFADAVRRKLVLEVSARPLPSDFAILVPRRTPSGALPATHNVTTRAPSPERPVTLRQ